MYFQVVLYAHDCSYRPMGNDTVHRPMGNDTVHRPMGDSTVYRPMGDGAVHRPMGDGAVHGTYMVAVLYLYMYRVNSRWSTWVVRAGAPQKFFKPHSQISGLGMWTICFHIPKDYLLGYFSKLLRLLGSGLYFQWAVLQYRKFYNSIVNCIFLNIFLSQ